VDTDRCDGCGLCVTACPRGVLAVVADDYDEPKAIVKPELVRRLADFCPGFHTRCSHDGPSCHTACPYDAIAHTW
jgi:ferredoxin